VKSIQTPSLNLEQADQLAGNLADQLKEGDVIGLSGDLGSGKTTFVSQLAKHLGIKEGFQVTSPTYVIHHIYEAKFPIHHIDLYRLEKPEQVEQMGFEEFLGLSGIALIEWFEKFPDIWKGDRIDIQIDMVDTNHRKYEITFFGKKLLERCQQMAIKSSI
jgi:tRNA threonylcarbamoyladenosine biosynthesis protein TsaE